MNIPLPSLSITGIAVDSVVDYPQAKKAEASVTLTLSDGTSQTRGMVLWSGDEYDSAGQWTDADVLARVEQVLSE